MDLVGRTPRRKTIFTLDLRRFTVWPTLPLRNLCDMHLHTIRVPYIPEVVQYLYDRKDRTLVVSGLILSNGEEVKVNLEHWGSNWLRHVKE